LKKRFQSVSLRNKQDDQLERIKKTQIANLDVRPTIILGRLLLPGTAAPLFLLAFANSNLLLFSSLSFSRSSRSNIIEPAFSFPFKEPPAILEATPLIEFLSETFSSSFPEEADSDIQPDLLKANTTFAEVVGFVRFVGRSINVEALRVFEEEDVARAARFEEDA